MEKATVDLRDYLIPLRKWWWLIAAATLVATVSSYFATRQQPAIYRTAVTVMVGTAIDNPNPNGNEFWLTQQLATSYADIAKREPVRKATRESLGLPWLPEFTTRVVPSTQLLEIAVTDTDPARAQAVANELANQLILLSPSSSSRADQQRQAFINQQLTDLETNIQTTKDEIGRKQADLGTLLSARQIADTRTQISGLQDKLNILQANYASLLAQTQRGAINSLSVVEPAGLPVFPVGPQKLATILLAAAIGFVLAAAAGYLMEYLDDTLKNPEDVQKVAGLATLGAVPIVSGLKKENELIMAEGGNSAAAEAYRILRTNLQFASVGHPLRTLMISSPSPSEGKSLTASNLAVAFAQAGKRVVLVDADLHRPRLHRVFGVRNNVGLTTALLDEHPDLSALTDQTSVPNLHLLTSGPLPPNAAELLGSDRMRELTEKLLTAADIVIFDSPPVTALSDGVILASQLDGVLLVVGAGETRRESARRAVVALGRVNARVVGALLNRMPTKGTGYYYYYYYNYEQYSGYEIGNGSGRNGDKNGKNGSTGAPRPRRLLPRREAPGEASGKPA